MPKPTFRDLVTSRAVIASAPVEEEQFKSIIERVNEEFELELRASKEAFELFQDHIRVVAGRFWDESQALDRKTLLGGLTKLTNSVRFVKAKLLPVRAGVQDQVDTEGVSLLLHAIQIRHGGQHPRPLEELETGLKVIEVLEVTCERALVFVSDLPAKRGQPALAWYDELVSLMVQVAELLDVKVTTAGDRAEDPYATPFTVLVFGAERALPQEAWSSNQATCAKRIETSLKRLKRPPRKKSTRTG